MPRYTKSISALYDAIKLPNAGSKTQTPASLSIDLHYEHLKIHGRWNWERFLRLSAFLNVTPSELGSIVCLKHEQVQRFKERNMLPVALRSACLVLTLLEAHCCKSYMNDVIENPFSDLNRFPVAPELKTEGLNSTSKVDG